MGTPMRIHEARDEGSIRELLNHLNVCHDGVIRRISFLKDRSYTEEGDVFWPHASERWEEDAAQCGIEMELLLNSYAGASLRQVVLLHLQEVRSFRFSQEKASDYAEIIEFVLHESRAGEFEFIVRTGPEAKPINALSVVCCGMLCIELEQ
jgi:hypothetical protein